jgi:tRNA threonylcarbamoyladenosine biosynthesis protein TsaB
MAMLLLAIDTSGKQGSIALARIDEPLTPQTHAGGDDIELIETMALAGGTFSAQLVPQIADLLSKHGFTKNDIGAFAVASGPGSFTGLRIGLAVVKALAEVLRKPIVAVSLLQVCAFSSGLKGRVMAALDAGRGDVYVGEYLYLSNIEESSSEHMLSRPEFLEHAKGWTVVTPDALLIEAVRGAGLAVSVLPLISAEALARLGARKLRDGKTVTPELLEANYIRRTDAEMLERIRG